MDACRPVGPPAPRAPVVRGVPPLTGTRVPGAAGRAVRRDLPVGPRQGPTPGAPWRAALVRLVALLLLSALAPAPATAGHGAGGLVPSWTVEHVKRFLDAGEPVILIDLRPAAAYGGGHIPGARSVPLGELEQRLSEVPRAGRVVLYGETIVEAAQGFARLQAHGYRNVSILEDGFAGWRRRGYPVEAGR